MMGRRPFGLRAIDLETVPQIECAAVEIVAARDHIEDARIRTVAKKWLRAQLPISAGRIRATEHGGSPRRVGKRDVNLSTIARMPRGFRPGFTAGRGREQSPFEGSH